MPARRSAKKEGSQAPKPTPKIFSSLKSILLRLNIVYVLGLLLIIASFLIGVLITKISYLEKNSGNSSDATVDIGSPQQPAAPVDVSEGHLPILGNKDAKVTIVEFSDFQCPFCKSLFDDSLPQIKKDYVDSGKVKFAYRHYPLTGIHPNAQKAAEASECANENGKFWDYHDLLFKNQSEWESLEGEAALAKFAEYAGSLGLDTASFSQCVSSGKFEKEVGKDLSDGTTAGVSGTPATFINGILVEGAVPYQEFKSQIDQALKE